MCVSVCTWHASCVFLYVIYVCISVCVYVHVCLCGEYMCMCVHVCLSVSMCNISVCVYVCVQTACKAQRTTQESVSLLVLLETSSLTLFLSRCCAHLPDNSASTSHLNTGVPGLQVCTTPSCFPQLLGSNSLRWQDWGAGTFTGGVSPAQIWFSEA